MPKKTLGFCGTLAIAQPAGGATCGAGYYLENGTCQLCCPQHESYYCPGDDIRHPCPTTDTDYNQFGYRFISGNEDSWASPETLSGPGGCHGSLHFEDDYGNTFMLEAKWNGENYWSDDTSIYLWYKAGKGFYLSAYRGSSWKNWYYGTKPCTNAPAHAHYTGLGTPDEPRSGGATDFNDCPWECDDGYGRVGDTCEPLCATDITHIRTGTTTAPLFPTRRTTPALVVQTTGGVCYGNLTAGKGTGINVTINGITYHLE